MNIVAARLNMGHSIRSAAKEIGISRDTLAKAERGEDVHPATAKLIADFHEVKVTDIWPVKDVDDDAARAAA